MAARLRRGLPVSGRRQTRPIGRRTAAIRDSPSTHVPSTNSADRVTSRWSTDHRRGCSESLRRDRRHPRDRPRGGVNAARIRIPQAMSADLVLRRSRKSKREASARSAPASARSELRQCRLAPNPGRRGAGAPSCRRRRRSCRSRDPSRSAAGRRARRRKDDVLNPLSRSGTPVPPRGRRP